MSKIKMEEGITDGNPNASENLYDMQQQLAKKLEEIAEIVRRSADRILESTKETSQSTQQSERESSFRAAEEQAVVDKLQVLSTLPDWLDSLHHSIDQFLSIAKSLQPPPSSGETKSVGLTPFDPEKHAAFVQKYRELVAEKEQQLEAQAADESRRAVDSLVDMSVALAASSGVNKGLASDTLRAECSLLFEKGLPIYGVADCLEDLLDEDAVGKMSAGDLHAEVQRQHALNELQLLEYLGSRPSGPELGHVVHRLLGAKYPRPPPPPGLDLPWLPVTSLLLGLGDPEAMGGLHDLLAESQVQLVLFQDALETCVEAYRREGPGLPLLESRDPPPPTQSPPLVSAADRLLPHALLGEKTAVPAEPSSCEKETQTGPEVEPLLSLAASLGKQALETLRLRGELTDWAMVAIVIEHLKQLCRPGLAGWVLADFPRTFAQVALFETAISGQHVPHPDGDGETLPSRLTLHQSRIVSDPSAHLGVTQPFRTVFSSVVSVQPTEPPQEPELLDYVSLVQELYLQQGVHLCLHCATWGTENLSALAQLLLAPSPTSSPPQEHQTETAREFGDLPLPADLALGLASLWESLEIAYVTNLHRVFLTRRTSDKTVDSYIKSVRAQFAEFLSRPDNMQEMVEDFQARHHELPRDSLGDEDVKEELRSRVDQLQVGLCEEAERRRREAGEELAVVAALPWLGRELGQRLNVAAAALQLEIDRFVDTSALLQDYFCGTLDRIPPDPSKTLRFDVPKALSAEVTDEWASALVEPLTSVDEPDTNPEPFLSHLAAMVEGARAHVEKLSGAVRASISRLETEFRPKPAASKKKQVVKKTAKGKKQPDVADVAPLEDLAATRLTSQRLQLLQEWRLALDSEAALSLARLELSGDAARSEARQLVGQVWCNAFLVARTALEAQFNADRHSAATLHEFLRMAVEAEAALESPLVLPRQTPHLRYLENPHSVSEPVPRDADLFQRLRGLLDILQRVAPDGVILRAALTYILQQAASSAQGCFLPSGWESLDAHAVSELVQKVVFTELADWRWLLLRLCGLPAASQRQLLTARARLAQHDPTDRGSVARELFSQTRLWLEEACEDEHDKRLLKSLVFDLYRHPARDVTSYAELLLASSHDPDPALGFAKAVAVHSGRLLLTGCEGDTQGGEMDLLLSEVNAAFPATETVCLEAAEAVILAGRPSTDTGRAEVRATLERVFREVEEQALSPQQRRARQRLAVATKRSSPEPPVTRVPASLLIKHPEVLQLATPAYQTVCLAAPAKQAQV